MNFSFCAQLGLDGLVVQVAGALAYLEHDEAATIVAPPHDALVAGILEHSDAQVSIYGQVHMGSVQAAWSWSRSTYLYNLRTCVDGQ